MGFYNKVYIGHVETINPDLNETQSPIVPKVVALKLVGFDNIKKIPKYKPLRKYGEYYKLVSVEPLARNNFVSDANINHALKQTGKQEVKQFKKVA